jgi:hypothetical protein
MNQSIATLPASNPPRLSAQLRALDLRFKGRPVRLAEVFAATQGRGFYLLMLLCCLPFLTPVPTLMLSTAFGLVIFLTAWRLALGQQPWLPRRVLEKQLPAGFISRLLRAAARLLGWLESLLRPRLAFMHARPGMDRLGAGMIAFAALLLMLPLPVPFSNFFPAAAILLLSAGALERDGACSLAGWVMCALAVGFFGTLAFGGVTVLDHFGIFARGGG